jgi:uncharacterized membrane protein
MNLSDSKLRSILANVMVGGVLVAAVLMLVGGVIYLADNPHAKPGDRTFSGEPADLRNPVDIVKDALTGHTSSVIQLGVLILLFNPLIRVGFSAIGFAAERDLLYAGISVVVFLVLSVSFFL